MKLPQDSALRRLLVTSLICALALGGAWAYTTSKHSQVSAESRNTSDVSLKGVDADGNYDKRLEATDKEFLLTVNEHTLMSGPKTINVTYLDTVRINIKAEGTEEVTASLPEFGVRTESAPSDDTPGGFLFIADKVGSFKYYAHDEHNLDARYDLGTVVVSKP